MERNLELPAEPKNSRFVDLSYDESHPARSGYKGRVRLQEDLHCFDEVRTAKRERNSAFDRPVTIVRIENAYLCPVPCVEQGCQGQCTYMPLKKKGNSVLRKPFAAIDPAFQARCFA